MTPPIHAFSLVAFLGLTLFASHVRAEQTGTPRRVLAGDDSTHRLAIVAADGKLEWEIKVGAIHDAHILPNGNVLLQQGWTKVQEVTPVEIRRAGDAR